MLSGLLLASIVAAVLATLGLFVDLPRRLGGGAILWTRRLVLALLGTAVAALAGAGVVRLVQHRLVVAEAAFAVLVVASVVWLPLTRRWNARAHLCWAMNSVLFVIYLVFMLHWTLISPLGAFGRIGAFVLLVIEAFAAVLTCAYLWELCDALGREHWRRRSVAGQVEPAVDEPHPFVSLHVPAYEEPPEMVIETLRSLLRIDYDNYEIVVIDDNTRDEALWRPVEAWCAEQGITFTHLENWPGYKSGALNYALHHLTDDRAEVVGVIDSDYQVEPDFLRRCAPLFNDPTVGFVQSPQDYREWERAPFFRRLYYSYKYFFAISQPSRNERDGAIFAGTMGLIRRQALADLGGWDEWCITEDAELSLRLLRAGWSGRHVDASYGRGLMPLSFEALKGQRFRWCFGGIQILRMHWRSMLPGAGGATNRLTIGQRWAYLSGALQWYGDLVALVFFFFLLGGAVNIALGGGLLFRKLTPFLLAAIPVLVLLGFIRAVALIRRGTGASWGDAVGAFFVWQSTSLVVARASVQALFARKAEFLRTPKTGENARLLDALRGNLGETFLALLGVAGIVAALMHPTTLSGPLLAGLLALPTAAYLSAPVNSVAAQRAALPPDLARRRRAELRRGRYVRRSAATLAGVGVIVGAAVIVLGLLTPGGEHVRAPGLGPAPANQGGPAPPHRSRAKPTSGPTSAPPSTPASTPTGTPSSSPSSTAPTPTPSTSTPTTAPSSASSTAPAGQGASPSSGSSP